MANIVESVESAEQLYLTKAQAQAYTGLSHRTLDCARARNELGFYKIGKRILLKRSDLDAWIERHRVGIGIRNSANAGEVTA